MVAAVSLAGIFLDVLGGLYLAYDLLGGQHGPLRLLTRMVTYSIVFGIGYGIGLGLFFGVACGLATGITVSIELQRTARRHDHYPLQWEAAFSAIGDWLLPLQCIGFWACRLRFHLRPLLPRDRRSPILAGCDRVWTMRPRGGPG